MTDQMSSEDLVQGYIDLRNKEKEIKERHKAELAPYTEMRDNIELMLMARLHDAGADSVKTAAGTFYKTTRTSVKVQDWPAALEWILANGRTDMLVRQVSKEAYEEAVENGDRVPGVVPEQTVKVNVRKS